VAGKLTLPAFHQLLEAGSGTLETAWNKLQLEFRRVLPTDSKIRIDVVRNRGLAAQLISENYDRAEREMGGLVPIVPLLDRADIGTRFWIAWTEIWDEVANSKRFVYHTTGITIFMGSRDDQQKLQLFRAEWPGVRAIVDDQPRYEAQGAGHPHWQIDALRGLSTIRLVQSEREHLAAILNESVAAEDFQESTAVGNSPSILVWERNISWTRMHFASLAQWATSAWDGNINSIDQHARGPSTVSEIHNWLLSSIRYVLRELDR
jgi:hypothetical protein